MRFGIYDRHLASGPANAHEVLIESVLASLGDASRWVEYWGRAGWQVPRLGVGSGLGSGSVLGLGLANPTHLLGLYRLYCP